MPTQDKYFGVKVQLGDPANEAIPLVPSDNQTPSYAGEGFRSVYVGVGGDISCRGSDDAAGQFRLFKNVPNGFVLPFRVTEVRATGTTATNLLGLR